jgi:hypothetical protein
VAEPDTTGLAAEVGAVTGRAPAGVCARITEAEEQKIVPINIEETSRIGEDPFGKTCASAFEVLELSSVFERWERKL